LSGIHARQIVKIIAHSGGPRGAENSHRNAAFQIKRILLIIMSQTRYFFEIRLSGLLKPAIVRRQTTR